VGPAVKPSPPATPARILMTHHDDQPQGGRATPALQLTSPRSAQGTSRDEIHRFKRDIDLRSFALSKGYRFDKKDSTPTWTVLRNDASGDKIVVGRGKDGHWCYFSHSNAEDRGSVVDFVRRRGHDSWRDVFRELRDWTGQRGDHPAPPSVRTAPVSHDRTAIVRELTAAREVSTHPYLESRGLTAETLSAPRFRGTWKEAAGSRREVLFLHRDHEGLSGAERKNPGFTGFTPGGSKGLWVSNTTPTDNRLVITESAIDALSYHQVNPHPRTRYVSCAGQLTAKQLGSDTAGKPGLLDQAITWMPAGSTIVAATDADMAGYHFADRIAQLSAKHQHVTFERHAPTLGKDWNDHLQALRTQSRSRAPQPRKDPGLER
jgi:hypothetical protein